MRLGTPIQSIIEANGGLPEDTEKLISGVYDGESNCQFGYVYYKGFSCILVINNKEGNVLKSIIAFVVLNVLMCVLWDWALLISTSFQKSNWEKMEKMHVMDCIECGSCQYTCPAARPLLDRIRLGKNKTGAMIRARNTK